MSFLPFLNSIIPTGIALKALSKVNPALKKFITSAAASGYAGDKIMDFLRYKATDQRPTDQQRLEFGAQQGTLRPDEMSLRRSQKQAELPYDIAKVGVGLAGGLAGAGALSGLMGGEEQGAPQQQEQEAAQNPSQPIQPQSPTGPPSRRAQKIASMLMEASGYRKSIINFTMDMLKADFPKIPEYELNDALKIYQQNIASQQSQGEQQENPQGPMPPQGVNPAQGVSPAMAQLMQLLAARRKNG